MERLDGIVAGLGVLVVGVALLGVATSGPGEGAARFLVAFPTAAQALDPQTGTFTGDASVEVPVEVALQNLTQLVFDVTVAASGLLASPTSIVIQVEGPAGQQDDVTINLPVASAGGASVSGSLRFPLGEAPAARPVSAASAEEAAAQAGPGTTNGTGTWTVTVTAQSGPAGLANRATYDIEVAATATSYRAVAQPEPANPR